MVTVKVEVRRRTQAGSGLRVVSPSQGHCDRCDYCHEQRLATRDRVTELVVVLAVGI